MEEAEAPGDRTDEPDKITVVIPLRNEDSNLDVLTARLRTVFLDSPVRRAISRIE